MSPGELLEALKAIPHTPLGHYPTPLVRAPRLEAGLGPGAPTLFVKMDAYTAFALGGNKVRKLEYELAPERLEGITHIITCGGVHSNHARVTAAAAARLGLECTLVLNGPAPEPLTGNALLDEMFGASLRWVDGREARPGAMADAAEEIRRGGGEPLVVPLGASTPRGALGYARAAAELTLQLEQSGLHPARHLTIVVPSSSCGTLAGMAAGFALLDGPDATLVGVSADASNDEILGETQRLVLEAGTLLGRNLGDPLARVKASDAWVGEGYGLPTPASRASTEAFARLEGIVLDPVYTAKAAAAALDLGRRGELSGDDVLVFLHTGGHPTTLA